MVKVSKLFTIDSDLAEALKGEKNASQLVNDLVKDYYNKIDGTDTVQELKRKVFDKETEIRELQLEIENLKDLTDLKKKQQKRKEDILTAVPEEIKTDFTIFSKMDEVGLTTRFNDIYKSKYPNLDYNLILKAWRTFKGVDEDIEKIEEEGGIK